MSQVFVQKIIFDLMNDAWLNLHPDARVLKLADCYLQAYRARLTLYE